MGSGSPSWEGRGRPRAHGIVVIAHSATLTSEGGWWVTCPAFSSTNPLSLQLPYSRMKKEETKNTVLEVLMYLPIPFTHPIPILKRYNPQQPSTPPEIRHHHHHHISFLCPPPSPPPFHSSLLAAHSIIMALEQGQDTCLAHLPPITRNTTAWSGRLSHASLPRP